METSDNERLIQMSQNSPDYACANLRLGAGFKEQFNQDILIYDD